MSLNLKIIDRQNSLLKDIDTGIRNKFKWSWLEEKDCYGDFLSDYIRKIEDPGFVWCLICKEKIKYGSAGKRVLKSHATSKKHKTIRTTLKTSQGLPSIFGNIKKLQNAETEKTQRPNVYGLAPNAPQPECSNSFYKQPVTAKFASIKDRVSHQEAFVCSFIAEHNLPLSIAPNLIAFAKELSRDSKALSQLSMERTSATYKLRDGLSTVFHKRLVADMKRYPFSFNIDEATSKGSKQRVLNILVSFFNFEESIVQLYASIELNTVNGETVYNAVLEQFQKDEVPICNLVSCLTDSASYMTGCKAGFITKLKSIAPNLLDIDNDACHHVHNVVKSFCGHFGYFLEKLLDDLHMDFDFGTDLGNFLEEICFILGKDYYKPKQRVSHRWLSVLDCSIGLMDMLDSLTVFYYAWLTSNEKMLYNTVIINLLKKTSKEGRKRIYTILKLIKKKSLTSAGKARKIRICEKLFFLRPTIDKHLDLFLSVLPLFKDFILSFESKEPKIHIIHDEQKKLMKNFLIYFIKPETIKDLGSSGLIKLDLDDKKIHLHKSLIFVGKKTGTPFDQPFIEKVLSAYVSTGKYMQKKFPLTNKTLQSLSAIDPRAIGHSQTLNLLTKLSLKMPTLQYENVTQGIKEDLRLLQLETNLKLFNENDRIDLWWSDFFKTNEGKYLCLRTFMAACLSIFSGPRVENSFSMMNNIITLKTNRLKVQTYEALQRVKYVLSAKKTSSVKLFHREDIGTSPIDKALVYHIQTSRARDKARKIMLKENIQSKHAALKLPSITPAVRTNAHKLAENIKLKLLTRTSLDLHTKIKTNLQCSLSKKKRMC